jgi:hypothetical protein
MLVEMFPLIASAMAVLCFAVGVDGGRPVRDAEDDAS